MAKEMSDHQDSEHFTYDRSWGEIENMLNQAGFKAVQSFWQNHLFIGAIAIK